MENFFFWLVILVDAGLIVYAWWHIKHKAENMPEAFMAQLNNNEFEKRMEKEFGVKTKLEQDGIATAKQNRFHKIFMVCYGLGVTQFFSLLIGAFCGIDWVDNIDLALVLIGGALFLLLLPLIFQSSNKLTTALAIIAFLAIGAIMKIGFEWLLIYDWRILLAVIGVLVTWSLTTIYHQNKENSRKRG